ncbi:MAG: AtpZ/AtpI family protein [Lentisphaeraceae bacterium]|nr:AtpZ/AtpI family protein [Lentisphaeraceae bacterium]
MSEDNKGQGSAIGLGSSAASAFALLGFGGYYLDQKYGTEVVFTLIGIFLALLWIFYEVWKIVRQNDNDENSEK